MPSEYSSGVCHLPLRDSRLSDAYAVVFCLLIEQKLLDIFLQINKIYAHAQTVDTSHLFCPPQRPGYEAKAPCQVMCTSCVHHVLHGQAIL